MKLGEVRVRGVSGLQPQLFPAMSGMSVLVPADNEASFEVGKPYRLSEGRESYRVLVLGKHPTSIGMCLFLKKWEPS